MVDKKIADRIDRTVTSKNKIKSVPQNKVNY